ncbi:MAG: hypothetical protein M3376_03315, partial [Actinomycetota bacterium]|nr:hypothetical protein [Actinomycetota bacterium]
MSEPAGRSGGHREDVRGEDEISTTPPDRCPACGENALAPWRTVPGSDPALPGGYELARCTSCG